ncbi:MAG TPA: ATP-binding cassette domain-containing protein [Abditibacteriaceae bacterium]|jgi:ABC-type oligopeptide transport system ATPase subunit
MSEAKSDVLLQVRDLSKHFRLRGGLFAPRAVNKAVDGVSFQIERGQTLALVGESGSGKSTVGAMLLGLLEPSGGEITFDGKNYMAQNAGEKRALRRQMQVVFQDPYASLNARLNVRETLIEGLNIHKIGTPTEREQRVRDLMEQVGLSPTAIERYPHEFSGGQRQRIAIARALSVDPSFIVLDEPTSALDVSIQSQILNLLRRLQRERGLTYLFITHNLGVVEYLADEVAVMQKGRIVESGSIENIFDQPQQDYTKGLLSAIPSLDPSKRRLAA